MLTILSIIGSPRKGDTYSAVKRLESILQKSEELKFEYIFLNEISLEECTGCHLCIKKGEEFCHEREKVSVLLEKMHGADLIVLASPVYNDHVTSLMKKMFDYLSFLWHRPELFGKNFICISSGGGMFKNIFKHMKQNIKSWGGTYLYGLGVPHYDSLTEKYQAKLDKDFMSTAALISKQEKSSRLERPSIGRLIWFNIWKINAHANRQEIPKDFEAWTMRGWFDMDYYYHTKISVFKRFITSIITKLIHSFMKKVYKGY